MRTVLHGHDSQETAYVVDDYPYGRTLRCRIRYWIETKQGHGQRVMSQTSNPKVGNTWSNKPKGSTYCDMMILYQDDNGHIKGDGISATSGPDAFVRWTLLGFTDQLDEAQRKRLDAIRYASRKLNPNCWARHEELIGKLRDQVTPTTNFDDVASTLMVENLAFYTSDVKVAMASILADQGVNRPELLPY